MEAGRDDGPGAGEKREADQSTGSVNGRRLPAVEVRRLVDEKKGRKGQRRPLRPDIFVR